MKTFLTTLARVVAVCLTLFLALGVIADENDKAVEVYGLNPDGGDRLSEAIQSLGLPSSKEFRQSLIMGFPVTDNALGDMNQDSVVNIWDLLRIRNIHLGIGDPASPYEEEEGDLTQDEIIDEQDVYFFKEALFQKTGVPHLLDSLGGQVSGAGVTLTFEAGSVDSTAVIWIRDLSTAEIYSSTGVDFEELADDSMYLIKAFELIGDTANVVAPPNIQFELESLPPCSLSGKNLAMRTDAGPFGDPMLSVLGELEVTDSVLVDKDGGGHLYQVELLHKVPLFTPVTTEQPPGGIFEYKCRNISKYIDANVFELTSSGGTVYRTHPISILPTDQYGEYLVSLYCPKDIDWGPLSVQYHIKHRLSRGYQCPSLEVTELPEIPPEVDVDSLIDYVFTLADSSIVVLEQVVSSPQFGLDTLDSELLAFVMNENSRVRGLIASRHDSISGLDYNLREYYARTFHANNYGTLLEDNIALLNGFLDSTFTMLSGHGFRSSATDVIVILIGAVAIVVEAPVVVSVGIVSYVMIKYLIDNAPPEPTDPVFVPDPPETCFRTVCTNIWKHNTDAEVKCYTCVRPGVAFKGCCPSGLTSDDVANTVRADTIDNTFPFSPNGGAIITANLDVLNPGIVGILNEYAMAKIPAIKPNSEVIFSMYDPITGYFDSEVARVMSPNDTDVFFPVALNFNPDTSAVTVPILANETIIDTISETRSRFEYWFTVTEDRVGDEVNFGFGAEEELTLWIQRPDSTFIVKDSLVDCRNAWGVVLDQEGTYRLTVTYGAYGGEGPFEIGVSEPPYAPTSCLCDNIAGTLQEDLSPYRAYNDLGVPYGDSLVADSGVMVTVDREVSLVDSGYIQFPHLHVQAGGIVTHVRGLRTGVRLYLDTLLVDVGGSIQVSGKGYRGNYRDGYSGSRSETYPGVLGASDEAGGSHGGFGGDGAYGDGGEVYDLVDDPFTLGAGGGGDGTYGYGMNGGGLIQLDVGYFVLDGSLIADGSSGGSSDGRSGGGAGGGINIRAQEIFGSGTVSARGGTGHSYGGGGGGGRIAVHWESGDIGTWSVTAQAGEFGIVHSSVESGGAGTIYLLGPDDGAEGTLIVDNFGRDGITTPLTSDRTQFHYVSVLNAAKMTVDTSTGELTALDSLRVSGSATQLSLSDSISLTTQRLLCESNSEMSIGQGLTLTVPQVHLISDALLTTATDMTFGDATDFMLAGGTLANRNTATFTIPRFDTDHITAGTFTNWGTLEVLSDSLVINTGVTLEENGSLSSDDSVTTLRVLGTLSHSRWYEALLYDDFVDTGLTLKVGSLYVASGGTVAATASGYRGNYSDGYSGSRSETQAGQLGASIEAGGSHGGFGGDGFGGDGGEVYDILDNPVAMGAGGGGDGTYGYGKNGGGLIYLDVGYLFLYGTITAGGESASSPDGRSGGGAGGTINLHVGEISGSGTVSAVGGSGYSFGGGGGGGRIAIRWDSGDIGSWSLMAHAGERGTVHSSVESGGAGTIYLLGPDDGAEGTLIVDNFGRDGITTPLTPDRTQYRYVAVLNAAKMTVDSLAGELTALDSLRVSGTASQLIPSDSISFATPRLYCENSATVTFGGGLTLVIPQLHLANNALLVTEKDLTFAAASDFVLAGGTLDNRNMATFTIPRFDTDYITSGVFLNWGTLQVLSDSLVINTGMTLQENGLLTLDDSVTTLVVLGTLSHSRWYDALLYDDFVDSGLTIEAGSLHVASSGSVSASYAGYRGSNRDGNGSTAETYPGYTASSGEAGGSHGGAGGNGFYGTAGGAYDDELMPFAFGAGGGGYLSAVGRNGGGMVRISAGKLILDGSVYANGENTAGGRDGAGAGGSIYFVAQEAGGTGSLYARGGNGDFTEGGGGGGRIAIYWSGGDVSSWSADVSGGAGGQYGDPGQPGTVYIEDTSK